jgi:hypothetical protein
MDTKGYADEAIARALAVARETGWDVKQYGIDSEWGAVGMGPVGQHRDSDPLARSNYVVIFKDLKDRFGDAVDDVRFGHWGFGWVEEIVFDASRIDVVKVIEEWVGALADYPIANDDHFYQLEWDENHPEGDRYCYSQDRDCPCDRPHVNDPKPADEDDDNDATDGEGETR